MKEILKNDVRFLTLLISCRGRWHIRALSGPDAVVYPLALLTKADLGGLRCVSQELLCPALCNGPMV